MCEHNNGPYREYALSPESFTHYIDQMIEINQDSMVLLTMIDFKKLKCDCDTVPLKQPSMDKVDILDTTDKETIPPTEVEINDVKPELTDYNINGNQVDMGYYNPIQIIIDDKINTKELMKIDSVKLKEKEQNFSWCIDLTIHCALYGIYIQQIDHMEKDNTMGKD
eukprot:4698263-Ditylum_brightwellii.AAC.1